LETLRHYVAPTFSPSTVIKKEACPMPAKDLGTKHTCVKCGTKFYDLKKPDAVCPKCGADQREVAVTRPAEGRRSRLSALPKIVQPIEPLEAEAETEEAEEEDEEEAVVAADEDEA
jgi:uncharacterized protein (TIGR02300 family)